MEELGLKESDYNHFRMQGFEVVKSSGGKFYIRPCYGINQADFLEAKAKAIQCGFAFDSQGDILSFTKVEK